MIKLFKLFNALFLKNYGSKRLVSEYYYYTEIQELLYEKLTLSKEIKYLLSLIKQAGKIHYKKLK